MPLVTNATTSEDLEPGHGVLYDDRWTGPHGIGRFAAEMFARIPGLKAVPHTLPKLHPLEPIWLSSVVARAQPRAYFTPGFNPPLLSRVPLIITVHDLNHLVVSDNTSVVRRLYYSAVVRPGCRRAFRVLTGSEFSRRHIVEWAKIPEERVVKVGYGISELFRPDGVKYEAGFPYLLYVGLRGPHKNLPRLLRAFGQARIDPGIRLLLTGHPDRALLEVAKAARCANRIAFAGLPDDRSLADLYRGALALAMPSTFEGYGLPAVEAMACGTPALVSKAGGLAEACGNAGLFIEPERVDSIAAGIERIVEDRDLRNRLEEEGLVWAANFPWSNSASRVAAVLRGLPAQ
jgi:glycosyltransferase involved in cell wall biosynthesis